MVLAAIFVLGKRGLYTGVRCTLPNGMVVETRDRRTPLYDLARMLNELGFSDWTLRSFTPEGTPSLNGKVSVMAGLMVTERDRGGLRLERFQKFPGRSVQSDGGSEGTQPPPGQNIALRSALRERP